MTSPDQNPPAVLNFPLDDYARHVQRVALVDDLSSAFAFVLTSCEEERIEAPQVAIQPFMSYEDDTGDDGEILQAPEGRIRFQVTIAGHSETG